MKTILLLITVSLSSLALVGCTNDEGDSDLDIITPNEEETSVIADSSTEEKGS